MSRRGLEGGRKKSLLDPRRHVKCPVSECKYSGRTDHVKRHFRNLIVWSKTYEGEAAEESENEFISVVLQGIQNNTQNGVEEMVLLKPKCLIFTAKRSQCPQF